MINKKAHQLVGVSEFDFQRWCRRNKKSPYRKSVQKEFFEGILSGKIVRATDGKIIFEKNS